MGWLKNYKIKKAKQRADEQFTIAHNNWNAQYQLIKRIYEVFHAAAQGVDAVQNYVIQKPGEIALWSTSAVFHEAGKTASQYVGGSRGVSVPVVKGVRVRVGSTRGSIIPGVDMQMAKDSGTVVLTTQRVIFSGNLKSQEWNFDKIIGVSKSTDQSDISINVSNRQKTSGLIFVNNEGKVFAQLLDLAMQVKEKGLPVVLGAIENALAQIQAKEPKRISTSPEQTGIPSNLNETISPSKQTSTFASQVANTAEGNMPYEPSIIVTHQLSDRNSTTSISQIQNTTISNESEN